MQMDEIKQRQYIILGSGIAGAAAAEAIRESDKDARIIMISAEKELCLNRPMLIGDFYLDGSGSELFEKQQDWPERFDVELRSGLKALGIDRSGKTVTLSNGTKEKYDRLIYALGAEATVPPIPGADLPHVFTVRTREDMKQIRKAMETAKSAVVIGGGMLGLEDAWGLCEEKLDVAIVEQRQRVAFGQIDQSAGNLMKKRIERWGVPVYVNAEVKEIGEGYVTFRQGEVENVLPGACSEGCAAENEPGCGSGFAAEGEPGCGSACSAADEMVTIPADLVILSAGVTPNAALGAEAGLETIGPDERWIAVDEQCRTSDPAIFAAGDAAAVNGQNDAIWDEARAMGRVAGHNAAASVGGEYMVYEPVTAEHVFTGFDTEIFTLADSSGARTDGVYIRHADVEIFDYQRERYVRVSLQDGIIAGVLLINASELAPELMEAYEKREGEEEARRIVKEWLDGHDVDFKPAAPFRKR